MAQSYNFSLSTGEILSQCCISYESRESGKISKEKLREISLVIIKNAPIFWKAKNDKCLDENLNLDTLKTIVKEEKETLDWLHQFKALKMHNDQYKYNPVWMNYMYIKFE